MQVNAVVTYDVNQRIAVITADSPPVNALGAAVRDGLASALAVAKTDRDVDAIVLMCAGRTFFPGADITEFAEPPVEPSLRDVLARLETASKPTIAAMHGTALGGGLELALAAHFRIAIPGTRLGLPEVTLGLLPGAGGTQRLPRVVGLRQALDMMTSGEPISASKALSLGLLDGIAEEGKLLEGALAFARTVVREKRPLARVIDRTEWLAELREDASFFEIYRRINAKKFRGLDAPEAIIAAVEAATVLPFKEGLVRERTLFDQLVTGAQSKALRHIFFATREAAKINDVAADSPILPIEKVGVIGAGTMGGGIAMNFLNAGMSVRIIETAQTALDHGLGIIRKNYEATVAKGRLTAADVAQRMALLSGSLAIEDLSDCDLIIEAVFEDLEVKRDVFRRLDQVVRPGAILATNTSYLDIDEIAAVTGRPESVIGLHFFSPANVMRLLEIVRAKRTAKPVIATAAKLAKQIDKIGVTVRNGFGFVGNRILAARNREADKVILEGAPPTDVDRVLRDFGFPMGHFQMRDLVGLDVGWNPATTASATVREILNEMGRHGQKSGGGYYDYDADRKHAPSPIALKVIGEFAARQGIKRRQIGDGEISDRLLYAMVNEGARILDEGIAARASDIDIIWVTGYGWPRYRGGPMFWADIQGLPQVLTRLRSLQAEHGADFTPSPLIERLIEAGKHFGDM